MSRFIHLPRSEVILDLDQVITASKLIDVNYSKIYGTKFFLGVIPYSGVIDVEESGRTYKIYVNIKDSLRSFNIILKSEADMEFDFNYLSEKAIIS